MSEIVLIDDDEINNFVNSRIISNYQPDCQIISFTKGREALDHLRKRRVNSRRIFLDLNMPEINGWDVLDALGPADPNDGMDIFILSSSVDRQDRIKAGSYNRVKAFVTKPLTMDKLQNLL